MAFHLTILRRNAALDNAFDTVSNSGFIKIYSGTVPSDADAALSGNTLLSTLTLAGTGFGASASGVKTANAVTDDSSAAATGTASFFRLTKSDGTVLAQGSVGLSGADLNLNAVAIVAGARVTCSSFVITFPA